MINPAEEVEWGLLIVTYPYLTGIVAGAFVIFTLGHLFRKEEYLPLSGLAMIVSLAFLIASPVPLVLELGRPDRAFEIFQTPQFSSAMAMFGFILVILTALYVAESFFLFKPGCAVRATQTKSTLLAGLYGRIGGKRPPEEGFKRFIPVLKIIGSIALPIAVLFHVYVGFIFGSVKARELWATPITPVTFVFSAIVSGIALMTILSVLISRGGRRKEYVWSLLSLMAWVLVLDMAFVALEFAQQSYMKLETFQLIFELAMGPLLLPFVVQLFFGGLIPLVLIIIPRVRSSPAAAIPISLLVLIGVYAYRWNTVIGGQLLPKLETSLLTYTPTSAEIISSAVALLVAFIIFAGLALLVPLRQTEDIYYRVARVGHNPPGGKEDESRRGS